MSISLRSWTVLLVLPVWVALGCSGPALIPVTGKLVMNDKPLSNVQVDFHPDTDAGTTGPSSSGITDAEGNFTLQCKALNKPGAIAGKHRVILTDLDRYGTAFVGRGEYRNEDPKGSKEVPKLPRFPATYSDLTKPILVQEVTAGMQPITLTIKK
jgi:hypothetical protein